MQLPAKQTQAPKAIKATVEKRQEYPAFKRVGVSSPVQTFLFLGGMIVGLAIVALYNNSHDSH